MRYKDRAPEDTISLLDDFLRNQYKMELSCIETNSDQIAPSYCLTNSDIGLIVNGKGKTTTYAKASAYGEFCERLFNLSFVRFNNATPEDLDLSFPGLFYANREIARQYIDEFLNDELESDEETDKKVNLFFELIDAYYGKKIDSIPCISFKADNGSIRQIPVPIADYLFGTNGMAAGNSFEEAFVQGFSEIVERQAIKDLNAGVVIPDYIDNMPIDSFAADFHSMINKLGNIKVCVYSFERKYKYPVVMLLLFNYEKKKYKVKFGAHCTIKHAIERCITEMLQGTSIDDFSKWIDIDRACTSEKGENREIFADGSGTLSRIALENILSASSSFRTDWFPTTNQEAFEKITSRKETIFVHVNRVSPIVSLQIYIPKWTRIECLSDENVKDHIKRLQLARNITSFIKKNNLKSSALAEIILLLDEQYYDFTTLDKIVFFICPIQKQYFKRITVADLKLVLSALSCNSYEIYRYFRYKNTEEKTFDEYIKYANVLTYYKTMCKTVPENIKQFYSFEIVKQVEEDFANNFSRLIELDYCRKCIRNGKPNCILENKKRMCTILGENNETL